MIAHKFLCVLFFTHFNEVTMLKVVPNSQDKNTRHLMSQTKFYEGYSRWNDEHDRYETWEEAVTRVMNMHRDYYKDKLSSELS